MIEVSSNVRIYERNGEEFKTIDEIGVSSHTIFNDRVCLIWLDGSSVTVLAKDLIAAIQNATNTAK